MRIRKAILTGGGRATRLQPITTTINKHLLPLANKPMIFHAIEKAIEAGVTEIFINTNPGETQLQQMIGDGGHWGVQITYFEQTGGPQGIAHVVNEAKKFIGDEPFMFYLSDNVLLGDLTGMFEEFSTGAYDCMLALSKVQDPERFGVPVFNDKAELIDVIEKPEKAPNNFAVTGIYLYGPRVFFDTFEKIEKSARGEYEISTIHSLFLKEGKRVGYKEITGWWKDTGKMDDLLVANKLLLDQANKDHFTYSPEVATQAKISGPVHIGNGSQIGQGVVLQGPVIIGENVVLEQCTIGPYVTISSGSEIRRARIDDSIILDNANINIDMHITHSIIGKHVTLTKKDTEGGRSMIVGDKTRVEL
ncbi:MAG TPA: glucose-1-phosphate thymidylyltransferase [Candidatus Magasanikbacteria bacterium]|nr:glucose-1-phosphate thymidylyltransferase [Candidatus Magasanikbacteria bacterium]